MFLHKKGSHDEGIDLIVTEYYKTDIVLVSITSIVQCKLYRDQAPVSDIRDFFGVMVSRTATGYFLQHQHYQIKRLINFPLWLIHPLTQISYMLFREGN
ncbi:restriction endonuclease [Candidatus Symbiobacter mobilis]|uniref:restriction endonuclease n=1 Tax=Candidatus Symbiobacter mobilis TaxID=1436290 RepID=UPI0009DB9254